MAARRRRVLIVTLVLVLLAVAAAVAVWLIRARAETRFQQAAGYLPDTTVRVTWTDWAAVRNELGEPDPGPEESQSLIERALELDLATPSALATSAPLVEEHLGLDVLRTEWEIYGQAHEGSVLLVKLDGDADLDALLGVWESAGLTAPDGDRRSGGVWSLDRDHSLAATFSTSPLMNMALVEDERLLVASGNEEYLTQTLDIVSGEEEGLDAGALAGAFKVPVAAIGLLEDQACSALSLGAADEGVVADGAALVEQAGGVAPLTGYLVALLPGERIGFAFDHENEDQARRDAKSRRALAGAEDPGQMLPYPDLFTIDSAEADGTLTVLEGDTVPDAYPLSNTSSGPVLLATC